MKSLARVTMDIRIADLTQEAAMGMAVETLHRLETAVTMGHTPVPMQRLEAGMYLLSRIAVTRM